MTKIILTASNYLVPRIIRKITRSRFSHCMILYEDPVWGGEWVAEATIGGVRMVPAEKAMHHVKAVFTCKFDATEAHKRIRQHIGDGYDYAGLLFMGWVILMWRLFKKKIQRPHRKTSEEMCSAFVALFLQAAEELRLIPALDGLFTESSRNTPKSLYRALHGCPLFELKEYT